MSGFGGSFKGYYKGSFKGSIGCRGLGFRGFGVLALGQGYRKRVMLRALKGSGSSF